MGQTRSNNVKSVEFVINNNANNSAAFTGVAEVSFDTASIPAPGAAGLLAVAGAVVARRRRGER